jgi:hypothetical protein
MAFSDCPKCWESICTCGFLYKDWDEERRLELVKAVCPNVSDRIQKLEKALEGARLNLEFAVNEQSCSNCKECAACGMGVIVIQEYIRLALTEIEEALK